MTVKLSKEVENFIKASGNMFFHELGEVYIRPAAVWYKELGDGNYEIITNNKALKDANKDIIIEAIKNL